MKASSRWAVIAWKGFGSSLAVLLLLTIAGCGQGGPKPSIEGRTSIEAVAKWYQLYRAENKGKTPKNEEDLVAFIEKQLGKQGRGGSLNKEELFTSPRDQKKYVVTYGDPTSDSYDKNIAVQERNGYNGKKLIAFESAQTREVDEAELQALLDAK